jgi:hypothetical protein
MIDVLNMTRRSLSLMKEMDLLVSSFIATAKPLSPSLEYIAPMAAIASRRTGAVSTILKVDRRRIGRVSWKC